MNDHRKTIINNIAKFGYHVTVVGGPTIPSFAYTIGNAPRLGNELVLAGLSSYWIEDVSLVIKLAADRLRDNPQERYFELPVGGLFTLQEVHASWANRL